MDKFARGARVGGSRVTQVAKSVSAERPLTLGEVILVLMGVRQKHYPELLKADLLRLVDKAFDAYESASQSSGEVGK